MAENKKAIDSIVAAAKESADVQRTVAKEKSDEEEFEKYKESAIPAEPKDVPDWEKNLMNKAAQEIRDLKYDHQKSLDENKAVVNEMNNKLQSSLASERGNRNEFEKFKKKAVESIPLDETNPAFDAARKKIESLTYDSTLSMDQNKARVNDIIQRLMADSDVVNSFEKYRKEIIQYIDTLKVDEKGKLLNDAAKKAISELQYDATLTTDQNKARVDAILKLLEEDIKKLSQTIPAEEVAGLSIPVAEAEKMILGMPNDKDLSIASFGSLFARQKTAGKKFISIRWNKVNADYYQVYGAKCGAKIQKLAETKKLTYKLNKAKAGKYYKFIVVAVKDGKATQISCCSAN